MVTRPHSEADLYINRDNLKLLAERALITGPCGAGETIRNEPAYSGWQPDSERAYNAGRLRVSGSAGLGGIANSPGNHESSESSHESESATVSVA